VLAYGASLSRDGGRATIDRAIERCGSIPWSQAAVRMPDVARMCDGQDPSDGYLICRMVQVLIVGIMQQTKPV
jgi:hypothetical protein